MPHQLNVVLGTIIQSKVAWFIQFTVYCCFNLEFSYFHTKKNCLIFFYINYYDNKNYAFSYKQKYC